MSAHGASGVPASPHVPVAVIGPGRLGTTLALALPPRRYRVVTVAGRGADALDAFRARVPSARTCPAVEAASAASLVLLTLPDDALRGVVRDIASGDGVGPGTRWVHLSGRHGLAVLEPARLAGAHVAACHPAQTFPDADAGLRNLAGAAWAVTSGAGDVPWCEELVRDLSGVPHHVPEHARTLYHAALSLGSNGTSAVVGLARELLLGAGLDDPAAFLAPLVEASSRGAVEHGAAALTGPVRRGDAATVSAHLDELSVVFPEAVAVYRELARLALGQARRAGLDASSAEALARVLDAQPAGGGSLGDAP